MSFIPRKYSRMAVINESASLEDSPATAADYLAYHTATAPSAAQERPHRGHGEVDREGDGGSIHHAVHLRPLAPEKLDDAVGDEPRADAVRDRVGERHERHDEERGEALLEVAERDLAHEPHHEESDQDE